MFYNGLMLTSLVIQAGGESRRMGQNKALMPFLGRPLIERVIERVGTVGNEILITTNQPEEFAYLGFPCFPDVYPGLGALTGLFTALWAAHYPLVAVVACDMPFASPELFHEERLALIAGEIDAVVPLWEKGFEPFHAVYRREGCLPAVKAALDAGEKRLISWFPKAKVTAYLGKIGDFRKYGRPFENINTPKEFRAAEKRALENQSKAAAS